LNTHPFHIKYKETLSAPILAAIDNVMDNFYYFLQYNQFSFHQIDITIGSDIPADLHLSHIFIQNIEAQIFDHEAWFEKEALIIEDDKTDYIGTCFYMINCLQEYKDEDPDELGRFKFSNTYQAKFSCSENNLVLSYFQEMALIIFKQKIPLEPSQSLITHDIDFINNGWKKSLKKAIHSRNLKYIIQSIYNKIKGVDPHQNIQEILALEKSENVGSIFFFMTSKGSTEFDNVKNSDYNIDSSYIQKCITQINESSRHFIGLHKSIGDNSFKEELHTLQAVNNRYHYLRFSIPESFQKLSESPIKYDYSLGFSEKIGFRNSYGLPFKPFDPVRQRYYDFWEFPLLIMDSSLHYFMRKTTNSDKMKYIEEFIKKNKYSTVISILWHNDFFDSDSYGQLLKLIKRNTQVFPLND
tara:strand:+ start:1430 stop:2665 length:1236 start_codon:yes stop_codon:yes gene_type:complete